MKRFLKITLITLLVIFLVIILSLGGIVWFLSSDKLTPIVEREANKLIDGEIKIERIDLTFWKSFPRLKLEVDNVNLVSHSLRGLDNEQLDQLEADADSLLTVGHVEGGINIMQALRGNFEIYDVIVKRLKMNLLIVDNDHNNFAILPASQDSTETEEILKLPPISINRFRLVDAGPITFTSIPDSLSLSATINNVGLTAGDQPIYDISINGGASSRLLQEFAFDPVNVGLDGKISWSADRAGLVMMDRIKISLNEFTASVDATVDMTEEVRIDRLSVSMENFSLNDIFAHVPEQYLAAVKGLDTDMTLTAKVRLTAPYFPADTAHLIPSLHASLDIPDCYVNWQDLHFETLRLLADCDIDGRNLDNSRINVETLVIHGRAMDIDLSGIMTGPINDPFFDATLATGLKIQKLPAKVLSQLPMEIKGHLQANTDLRFHLKDFCAERFHRIYLDGKMKLVDIDIQKYDSTFNFFTPLATIDLGTNRRIEGTHGKVDSLLTVRLDIDTASIDLPGLNLQASRLTAGLGSTNKSTSSDTTIINPFGGLIRLNSFTINQPHDSLVVRFREVSTHASLTRYKGNIKTPQLDFDLHARRFGTRMPDFNILISQPEVIVSAHLKEMEKGDSLRRLTGRRHVNERDTLLRDDVIDWNTSKGFKRLLLRWDINGSLHSNQGFVFVRSFPLRQRAREIDIKFNNDTVDIRNLDYSVGNSRVTLTGLVTNMKRAFAGHSGRAKLRANLALSSPYIDINELATTTFYEPSGNAGPDADYDETFSNDIHTDTSAPRPLIIPRNIEVNVGMKVDSVLYADLLMNQLTGELKINNSAVNLHNLQAFSDAGSANLSALYWAPDTSHMEFGLGLKLHNFYIGRMLKMLPAVDSLLPAMRGFEGVINADVAATSAITPRMDIDIPTFKGALKIQGDSLVLLDADTFKVLSKWLMFKNKKRNMIDHMNVEIVVDDSQVEIFPFIFDIDRYKLGVMGRNNLNMDLDYHVSVLKSPLPFKFGINIRGPFDDFKIKLGGAKIKPGDSERYIIADTARVNLVNKIEEVFRRGSINSKSMTMTPKTFVEIDSLTGQLSANDSLLMIREGLLPPDTVPAPKIEKKVPLWKRISL